MLEHALLKVDFSVRISINMIPVNLNLNIENKNRYKNKILVSNIDMKIGSSKDINKEHKKLPLVEPKAVIPTVRHDLKMLNEKYNNENLAITLLIVGSGLIAYHFLWKVNGIIIIHSWRCCGECISF